MPQTFLKTQKRGGQVSLVAVYLVIAVAVVAFVVSRLPGGEEEAASEAVAKVEPKAADPQPVRLFRPEAFESKPATSVGKVTTSPVVAAEAAPPEKEAATPEPAESPTEPEAVAVATPKAETPVAAPDPPIAPLPSWSERELLASLEETAIELDLYSGRPTLAEIQAQVESRVAEFKRYNDKVDRRDKFNRRLRSSPGDVLPGEQEAVASVGKRPEESHMVAAWIETRPDLAGLPWRLDDSCELDKNESRLLMTASRSAIGFRARAAAKGIHSDSIKSQSAMMAANLIEDTSAIVQILQAQPPLIRTRMVKLLSLKEDEESIQAIADRALFDTSKEVRDLALHELKLHPPEEVRERLVNGFDHVWEPVAVNAANALVELNDELSVDDLRKKLNMPDPHAPYQDEEGNWKVRELVRVNHLRNCLMCHAPVVDPKASPFMAAVPEPKKPLPRIYYDSGSRTRVRPDITYIIQDFSASHMVNDANPWPIEQRFDYFVRNRTIDSAEALDRRKKRDEKEQLRERALRYAIEKLSANQQSEPSLAQTEAG